MYMVPAGGLEPKVCWFEGFEVQELSTRVWDPTGLCTPDAESLPAFCLLMFPWWLRSALFLLLTLQALVRSYPLVM